MNHFGNKTISNDLSDWASFGDYIGGTINTILSLSSLIILGLLTNTVSKQSNEENKKINLLVRKLDCYDKLTSFLPEITSISGEIVRSTAIIINTNIPNDVRLENLQSFRNVTLVFRDFYHYILTFERRYGHLFEYNLNSPDFNKLLINANKLNVFCDAIVARRLDTHIIVESEDELILMNQFYFILIDNLKKELK